jgi:hypothetical protein
MRIQGDSQHPVYPLAPATSRTVAPRSDAGAAQQNSRAPLAAYAAPQPSVDVLRGVSARAQRAIAAYSQNDVFERRSEYAQLLGVDVYA